MQKLSDYDYHLPEHLIARYPLAERSASRLLILNRQTGQVSHRQFKDLLDLLSPKDLLVFNNTRVIPARLFGNKSTGGKIEILVERILSDSTAFAHVKSNKRLRNNTLIELDANTKVIVKERQGDLFLLEFVSNISLSQLLNTIGQIPLPTYLKRSPEVTDKERYQTVYANREGAVAAPTAGLHFDHAILNELQIRAIPTAYVTLHVGAGTFQPVRVEDLSQHQMHAEYLEVDAVVCAAVNACKERDGRVIAVGTTTVRSLETAAKNHQIQPYIGDTNIFIYNDYVFKCIDGMITNFHLPKSTLLMLISAFAGYQNIKNAYQIAIDEQYRFYSYGDAMLII